MEQEKIKQLKEKNMLLDNLKDSLAAEKKIFEEQNAELIKKIQLMEESYNETKEQIKEQAISDFKENGIKKLFGGIGIRVTTKLFYNELDAIKWAKINMPVAISENIDKKQFESFAKTNDLTFVENQEIIGVTFPKEIKLE